MALPRTSYDYGHSHGWDGEGSTTVDHEHKHTVKKPGSGWTDGAGMENHKHRLPKKRLKEKAKKGL